ncbi:fimbrial protein [Lelliottia nimipressuralis]|uniref:Type 1 fimbrial protein n=1 Tax=Lelliottia nimipressuralis TaxID=69220 RepID=A0ABD4KFU2_9ENTR|nr:fimbrial protein [Lelliottia nimipressuralis]MBF4180782.1 type 1 fimbrial protein [Lelliottia nimipressuralis]
MMYSLKTIMYSLTGCLMLTCSGVWAAGCSSGGDASIETQTLDLGSLLLQRDLPVGSTIISKVISSGGGKIATCGAGVFQRQKLMLQGNPVSGYTHVYQSGVAGVGISVQYGNDYADTAPESTSENGPVDLSSAENITITLIKTGDVTPGNLAPGDLAADRVTAEEGGWLNIRTVKLTGGTIRQASCQVTTPNIVVPMGTLQRTDLNSLGATVGRKDFSIGLDCSAQTRVNLTINAPTALTGTGLTGVLSGSQDEGSADGVGIQILFNQIPVAFGSPLAVGTTTDDGPFSIPLQAQFYQTKVLIKSGHLNATANFTLSYQ